MDSNDLTMRVLGDTLGNTLVSIVIGLVFSAIACFLLGSNINSVFAVYFIMALLFNDRNTEFRSNSKTGWIISSLLTTLISFCVINFGLVHIFGSELSFPYSILNLDPTISGIIIMIIISIVSMIINK